MNNDPLDYYFGALNGNTARGRDVTNSAFQEGNDPVETLVREALQNVTGAIEEKPAKVEIKLENMAEDLFPQAVKFSHILDKVATKLEQIHDHRNATPFRNSATRFRTNATIPVLKISDFGTTGLTSDRWNKLINWIGVNSGTANEPGCYGIGRGAFYLGSRCSTVFYSSIADDGYRFIGKSVLPTFDWDGEERLGDGIYGQEGKAVTDLGKIPEYFQRSEKGTSIWIIDYDTVENITDRITRAVLVFYWPAIKLGVLEVTVSGKNINSENLRRVMSEYYSVEDKNTLTNPNPIHFLDTYEVPDKLIKNTETVLGEMKFYGKTSADQPYSGMTAYMRDTGMIIYFKKKDTAIKYTGIFECSDKDGSTILRNMENPRHTKWEPKNWTDDDRQVVLTGKNAKKELDKFVEDSICQISTLGEGEQFDITSISGTDENGKLSNTDQHIGDSFNVVPVIEESGIEIGADETDSNATTHVVRSVSVPREKVKRTKEPLAGGKVEGGGANGVGGGGNSGGEEGKIKYGIDENGEQIGNFQIDQFSARSYVFSENNTIYYRIIVRTENKYANRIAIMGFNAVTEVGAPIPLSAISCKNISDGKIEIVEGSVVVTLDSNGNCVFLVEFKEPILVSPTVNVQIKQ